MGVWLYMECPRCGDRIPVATDHESMTEAPETQSEPSTQTRRLASKISRRPKGRVRFIWINWNC